MKWNKRKLLCLSLAVVGICLATVSQMDEDRDIHDIGYLNSNDVLLMNISEIYI